MAFHFSLFSYSFASAASPLADPAQYPQIRVHLLPTDRQTLFETVPAACISLAPATLQALPSDFDGWIVERSVDYGITWATISGVLRDAFHYVDISAIGHVFYRAKLRRIDGTYTDVGNEVSADLQAISDNDEISLHEIGVADGYLIDCVTPHEAFPYGFGGVKPLCPSLAQGSVGGGAIGNVFYIKDKEFDAPIFLNENPLNGAINVIVGMLVVTFDIQDQPVLTGYSGIDDASWLITISTPSQFTGLPVTIRDGAIQPFAATIPCAIVPGADPIRDRAVTITIPAGYLYSLDVVTFDILVRDLDGNELQQRYAFTMEQLDVTAPNISAYSPTTDYGLGSDPYERARRDTAFYCEVTDTESGVDAATLNVEVGATPTGPWTLLVFGGAIFALTWRIVISAIPDGLSILIYRPVNTLYTAGGSVYFRISCDDNDGNNALEVSGFRVEDTPTIRQIIPLATDLYLVEFTDALLLEYAISDTANYVIAEPTDARAVRIKNAIPQKTAQPQWDDDAANILGSENPRCMIVETSEHTIWATYSMRISGLRDKYGVSLTPISCNYTPRLTKFDIMREHYRLKGVLRSDSVTRSILLAVAMSDDWIGGKFWRDEWQS